MTPTRMKMDPHGPTMDSSTDAIEGWLTLASSPWGSTPYETNVTSAKTQSTLTNPMTVARPTSSRLRAIREYTLAPSMPRNTKTVISIVPVAWSHNEADE